MEPGSGLSLLTILTFPARRPLGLSYFWMAFNSGGQADLFGQSPFSGRIAQPLYYPLSVFGRVRGVFGGQYTSIAVHIPRPQHFLSLKTRAAAGKLLRAKMQNQRCDRIEDPSLITAIRIRLTPQTEITARPQNRAN